MNFGRFNKKKRLNNIKNTTRAIQKNTTGIGAIITPIQQPKTIKSATKPIILNNYTAPKKKKPSKKRKYSEAFENNKDIPVFSGNVIDIDSLINNNNNNALINNNNIEYEDMVIDEFVNNAQPSSLVVQQFFNEPNSPRLTAVAPIIPQYTLDDYTNGFIVSGKHRQYHQAIQLNSLYVFVYDNETVLFGYFNDNKLYENFYICEKRLNEWRCDKECAEYAHNQTKEMQYKCLHGLLSDMILAQNNPTRISITYLQSNNSQLATQPMMVHFLKAPKSGRKRWIYLLINPLDHNRKSIGWLNYPSINQRSVQCAIHPNRAGCLEEHIIKDVE